MRARRGRLETAARPNLAVGLERLERLVGPLTVPTTRIVAVAGRISDERGLTVLTVHVLEYLEQSDSREGT